MLTPHLEICQHLLHCSPIRKPPADDPVNELGLREPFDQQVSVVSDALPRAVAHKGGGLLDAAGSNAERWSPT